MIKKLPVLFFFFVSVLAYAQNAPKPSWVKNTPIPPQEAGYIFVWGEGESEASSSVAKNIAFANAVKKGLYELRDVELTEQNLRDIEKNGFNAIATFTKRAIRELCQSEPLKEGDKYRIFVLIQVEKDVNHPADFYNVPSSVTSCDDKEYEKEISDWKSKYEKILKRESRSNVLHGYSYLGGIICGVSYPLDFKAGFTGRHGGTLGIGYSILLGAGLNELFSIASPELGGKYYYYNRNHDEYNAILVESKDDIQTRGFSFAYSADLKLYYYKHLYVGGRFGRFNFGNVQYYDDTRKLINENINEAIINNFVAPLSDPTFSLLLGLQKMRVDNGGIVDLNVSIAKNPITDKVAFMAQLSLGLGSLLQ